MFLFPTGATWWLYSTDEEQATYVPQRLQQLKQSTTRRAVERARIKRDHKLRSETDSREAEMMFSKTVMKKGKKEFDGKCFKCGNVQVQGDEYVRDGRRSSAESGCFDIVSIEINALEIRSVQLSEAQGRTTLLERE